MPGEQNLSADDHAQAVLDADAASRRAESEAAVHRSRALRSGKPGLIAAMREAQQEETTAREEAMHLQAQQPAKDLEGTQSRLSDSEGNFAANAEVAATGGIGVDASNTDVSMGKPAETPEDAGVAVTADAQKIIGDGSGGPIPLAQGDNSTLQDGGTSVTIPDNWRDLSWQERRSLASKLSNTPIANGEEANAAIEAELKRRG